MMGTQDIIRLILQLIYGITALGIVFIVISENRNPLKTISWVLLLLFFPIGGIIIYYFFGQDTRRLRIISRRSYKRIKKRSFNHLLTNDRSTIPPEYLPLVKLLNNNDEAALLRGNKVEIFTNGQDKFNTLIADFENAKHHIHLQYYIFQDDDIGRKIKKVLMQKASEGVEVRVLYDDVANWKVKENFYQEMAETGIEITSFLKVHFPVFTSKVNYRNHRKIVVIDGIIGYIGGMNIADRYVKGWRDTHLKVEGRGVLGMQSAFLIDWISSGKTITNERKYFPEIQEQDTDISMQILTGGPISPWRTLLQATIHIIFGARKYIYIQTPYFMPTEGVLQALQSAAISGVDVRLMLPAQVDVRFVNTASQSFFEDVLKAGVKIYMMSPRFIHAKTIVTDDFLSVTGSANMDFRSFEHNFEVNAYIYDSKIALRMKAIFEEDQKNCMQVVLKQWKQRPKSRKVQESFMRMFSPLL